MKKLFAILAVVICINANAQVCFSHATYTAAYGPRAVCSADFNNDGFKDLATGNYVSNDVSILLGTGTGTFGTATNFTLGSNPPARSNSICSADFNGDGKADLAAAISNDSAIYVLFGTGTGSFGTAIHYGAGGGALSIISADFNNDGFKDLATANGSSNNVFVLLGNGAGSFPTRDSFIVGVNPVSVISVDFNADGNADLATANYGSNDVSILLGTGTGSFSVAASFYIGLNPQSVISSDFNNDAKLDLAAISGDTILVSLGNGLGSFGAITNIYMGIGVNMQSSIISADFNGDSKLDLATANYNTNNVSILLGTGIGTFGSATNFAVGTNPWTIISTDFNGDSRADLATANYNSDNVTVLLNFPIQTISVAATPTMLCGGGSSVLTASGSTTYSWSTSATTSTISVTPTVNTTYIVTDGVGCSNTASITINVATVVQPNICMVTTDSASNYNYNMIVWDKTSYSNVDSFIVYRYDVMSSSYLRIGAVSKNSLSELKDTAFSTGGPNGGNPLYSSWRYKLAIRDTCGNIGAMSPYHETMFVQESGATFSWNAYVGTSVTGYSFLRDDNNTGAWHVLVNTAGLSTTDPNYATYPNGNWRVDALGFNCTPTMRLAGNNNTSVINKKSHSNTSKPTAVGINQISNNNQLSIYPNPATNNITIQSSTELGAISIYNSLGELVLQTKSKNMQEQIDLNKLPAGVYTINVQGKFSKIIKE